MVAPPEAWQIRNKNLNSTSAVQGELGLQFGPEVYAIGGGRRRTLHRYWHQRRFRREQKKNDAEERDYGGIERIRSQ